MRSCARVRQTVRKADEPAWTFSSGRIQERILISFEAWCTDPETTSCQLPRRLSRRALTYKYRRWGQEAPCRRCGASKTARRLRSRLNIAALYYILTTPPQGEGTRARILTETLQRRAQALPLVMRLCDGWISDANVVDSRRPITPCKKWAGRLLPIASKSLFGKKSSARGSCLALLVSQELVIGHLHEANEDDCRKQRQLCRVIRNADR